LLPILTKFAPTAPKDLFIDPSKAFVEFIAADLPAQNDSGSEEFFVSASSESFIRAAKMFYDVKEAKLLTL
jgi:hypothetical protein